MPQLLPSPWFYIFAFSWLILLLLSPRKILTNITPNFMSSTTMAKPHHTWTWPWS